MATTRDDAPSDDSGLTIVELVIYMTLSVIVGTLVVTMLVNTFQGQSRVTSVTDATTRGQAAAQSIERALRNAEAVWIENGNTTLKVKTTLDEPCQAWRVTTDAAGDTVIQISHGAGFPTWTTMPGDVAKVEVEDPVTGAVSRLDYFALPTLDEPGVHYNLSFTTDLRPVDFTGAVVSRAPASAGAGC